MGTGEWGMGNGEWGLGNGEWGMGNGEWGLRESKEWELNHDYLETCCYSLMKRICPHPPTPSPMSGRGI
ncbi:hypothetical protein [Nostoc sp.]|uniref:hypothetical protein n=1 Tax=Nostoc sp. TaxID=1180 RepID=UPI002FFA173C